MSGHAKSLQCFDRMVIMALLLQRGDAVLPEQTAALVLSPSGREVNSLVLCPMALCTGMVDAQVGQEGRGETYQRQVCHGRSRRAILGVAEPQQLRDVFHPLFDGPAPVLSQISTLGVKSEHRVSEIQ